MSPRSIRRAAERKQQKLLKKQQRLVAMAVRPDEPAILSEAKIQENEPAERKALKEARRAEILEQNARRGEGPSISEARLAANRANAQLSTGPITDVGKAKASLNAVKTGLTGRTILLPGEDAEKYESFIAEYEKEFQPQGQRERDLVQSIADTMWRLRRIPGLEMAIYTKGSLDFAEKFQDYHPSQRDAMIELETFLTYEKPLRNLHLQESRLWRRYEKEVAELRQLQQERQQNEELSSSQPQSQPNQSREAIRASLAPEDSLPIGFEFSSTDPAGQNAEYQPAPIEPQALPSGQQAA